MKLYVQQRVMHNSNNLFFSGVLLALYRSRCGVERAVVENDSGMTYITDAQNLIPLTFDDPLAPKRPIEMKVSKY